MRRKLQPVRGSVERGVPDDGIDEIALHHALLLKVAMTVPMPLAIGPLLILGALADVRKKPALADV